MSKKKKMIDIEDLLPEQLENKNNDMIFITGTQEPVTTKTEKIQMNRLENIYNSAVIVDEPVFDGVTDIMGKVTIGSEGDTQQINKELLQQQKITEASNEQRDNIIRNMTGSLPEDVVEEQKLDIPMVPTEKIDRKQNTRVNSRAVQEIIDDLHSLIY